MGYERFSRTSLSEVKPYYVYSNSPNFKGQYILVHVQKDSPQDKVFVWNTDNSGLVHRTAFRSDPWTLSQEWTRWPLAPLGVAETIQQIKYKWVQQSIIFLINKFIVSTSYIIHSLSYILFIHYLIRICDSAIYYPLNNMCHS